MINYRIYGLPLFSVSNMFTYAPLFGQPGFEQRPSGQTLH